MRRFCCRDSPRVTLLFARCYPVHARVPRHFRVSSSPIGARCKANPGRVTITAHINAPFLFAGILPGSPCFSQGATRCTLACLDTSVSRHPLSALAVRRIPAESPKCASARCAFFHAGFQTRVRVLLCNPHPVHAVVFRARFAARHVSRLGQYFCALSRLMSLAYRQVSFVPFGAKFSQNSLPDTSWSRLNRIAFLSDRSMRMSRHPLSELSARRIPAECLVEAA